MKSVTATFEGHIASVNRLMNFDRDVLDLAIKNIEDLQGRLVAIGTANPQLNGERTLQMLRGFRTNDSLRPRYQTIFNQALVLLVSYFTSSVHDLFRRGVAAALTREGDSTPLLREQFKLSFRELRDNDFSLREIAPDLFVQAKDISFQDTLSIYRAFRDYLAIEVSRSPAVNDIILSLGCRHVIVHAGGVVDERLVRQLRDARPRELKPDFSVGHQVQFSVDEITLAGDRMRDYLAAIEQQLPT